MPAAFRCGWTGTRGGDGQIGCVDSSPRRRRPRWMTIAQAPSGDLAEGGGQLVGIGEAIQFADVAVDQVQLAAGTAGRLFRGRSWPHRPFPIADPS